MMSGRQHLNLCPQASRRRLYVVEERYSLCLFRWINTRPPTSHIAVWKENQVLGRYVLLQVIAAPVQIQRGGLTRPDLHWDGSVAKSRQIRGNPVFPSGQGQTDRTPDESRTAASNVSHTLAIHREDIVWQPRHGVGINAITNVPARIHHEMPVGRAGSLGW